MIEITFKDFWRGHYDDSPPYCIYVLKDDRGCPLYVGKAEAGVWTRWFGGRNSHLIRNIWGGYVHNSQVGRAILANKPHSLCWRIELWTLEDAANYLNGALSGIRGPGADLRRSNNVAYVESFMIANRQPSLNNCQ